ncbi:MAG: MATE family efflux transporter, partial [Oscillospiraceae bacterium]
KSSIRIRPEYMKLSRKIVGSVAALGIAPFIMQATESLVSITLNSGLQKYGGDLYVGSMTIIQSVMQMIIMPVQGITQGVQPIMSYNYGAQNYGRVRKTFFLLLRVTVSLTVLACIIAMLFPAILARLFTPDAELIAITTKVMPIFFAGIWAFGLQMACQTTFMSLGQAKTSLFLALLRKIILLVPLAVILPMVMGNVMGIFIAEPVADIIASLTTFMLFLSQYKKLLPMEHETAK